jgi:hypothetical protein
MSGSTHDDELAAFQAALARLQPMPDGINLARLLFQAGRLSTPRRNWVWPCLIAASMMLAAMLGGVLLFHPPPQPAERIVQVFVPSPSPPAEEHKQPAPAIDEMLDAPQPAGEGDYLQLRRAVLAEGVDALPPPTPWPAVAPADVADPLLDLPRGSREFWFQRFTRSLKSGDAS